MTPWVWASAWGGRRPAALACSWESAEAPTPVWSLPASARSSVWLCLRCWKIVHDRRLLAWVFPMGRSGCSGLAGVLERKAVVHLGWQDRQKLLGIQEIRSLPARQSGERLWRLRERPTRSPPPVIENNRTRACFAAHAAHFFCSTRCHRNRILPSAQLSALVSSRLPGLEMGEA